MSLTLWAMEGSPPSWAVRMLGEVLGLKFDIKNIDFVALEHKTPEFLKKNPMGTIPVLQDGDFIISESHTILKYLLEKYGSEEQKQSLYPRELEARAQIDQAMYFDTGVAFIRLKLIALPALFKGMSEISSELTGQVEETYSIVEAYLGTTKYVAADRLTLADFSLGATILSLDSLVALDPKRFPLSTAWLATLKAEPYFSKIAVPGAVVLSQFVRMHLEKNKQKSA